jgi:tRNA G10  N-methylase Trm11
MESLSEADITLLSRLSFVYAIFAVENALLRPLCKNAHYYFDDDISMILKYNGKTHELFTRMMLNIGICNNRFPHADEVWVLDPLCGKGTTLFEGLLCKYHMCGVDIDGNMVHEAYVFLKKYLERLRFKHTTHTERITIQNETAQRYQIALSRDKSDGKTQVEYIAGDTRHVGAYYRKNTFHAIVGDLPYGVQHGSKADKGKSKGASRNALPLLLEALPGWHRVLKPGGTLVLAWNLFLISRAEMEDALQTHGFVVEATAGSFVHRVDQAIERDIIIGMKAS